MSDDIDFAARMRDACQAIEKTGKGYAEARAQSWHLQELRKVVLANEMRRLEGSMVERDMTARCTDAYKQHLEATSEAIHKELSLKAETEKWAAVFESLRSLSSLEKAKMQIL